MSITRKIRAKPELHPDTIATFLRQHPDFFAEHPELLIDIHVPHESGTAISLVERQVNLLREQNRRLLRKHKELLTIARENEDLNKRVHQITLKLLRAQALESFFSTLYECFTTDFKPDFVSVRLFCVKQTLQLPEIVDSNDPARDLFKLELDQHQPYCGKLTQEQANFLFGEIIKVIGSAAIIPLRGTNWEGMFAIGSKDSRRYYEGMAVDFLGQFGETISVLIANWLD